MSLRIYSYGMLMLEPKRNELERAVLLTVITTLLDLSTLSI